MIRYKPKKNETIDYLTMFFEIRIAELISIKSDLEKDRNNYEKEMIAAKSGQSRFKSEYLEDFILKIEEQIIDVNENISVNRYHLFGEEMQ